MRSVHFETLATICVAINAATSVVAAPIEWAATSGGNGHRYEAIAQPSTWDDAKGDAESRGGHLVTFSTQAEYDFVLGLLRSADGSLNRQFWGLGQDGRRFGPWIGAVQAPNQTSSASGWSWVTGEPFNFTAWHFGEPNDWAGQREDVGILFHHPAKSATPGWNDDVRLNRRTYIVEYEPTVAVAPPDVPPVVQPETSARTVVDAPASTAQPAASRPTTYAAPKRFSARKLIGIVVIVLGLIGTPIVGLVVYFACRMALRHHDRRK